MVCGEDWECIFFVFYFFDISISCKYFVIVGNDNGFYIVICFGFFKFGIESIE